MERSNPFTTPEIVGIATATAAALGGVIVALGRSQSSSHESRSHNMPSIQEVVPAASQSASRQLDRGKHVMQVASSLLSEMYPDLKHNATDLVHKASSSTRPQVSRAAAMASERADRARATGTTVVERLQDVVVPAAVAMISSVAEQAGEAKQRAQPVASDAAAATVAKAEVAVEKSSSAAKDSIALVVWSSIAALLIYGVLLDDERREKVRQFVFGAIDQGRLLLQDFQGYEEDV
jgi:hypothetical protein